MYINHSENVSAHVCPTSGEVQCDICSSFFVERLGQDVESFLRAEREWSPQGLMPEQVLMHMQQDFNGMGSPQPTRTIATRSESAILEARNYADRNRHPEPPTAQSPVSQDEALSGELFSGMIHRIIGASLPQLAQDPSLFGSGRPVGVVVRTNVSPMPAGAGAGFGAIGDESDQVFESLLHHILMNESSYRSQGADPEEVKRLRRVSVEAGTDLTELGPCGISMEDFEPGDTAVVLPCKHAYKESLILQWFQSHQTCPSCRTQISQSS